MIKPQQLKKTEKFSDYFGLTIITTGITTSEQSLLLTVTA